MKVWREYDQAGLDSQYATRSQIGDQYEEWSACWKGISQIIRDTVRMDCDLRYGPHPRQVMDIFFPDSQPSQPAPMTVFFHGGFWRSRDKWDYSYVFRGLSALGGPVAVVNYPLCPEVDLTEIVKSARLGLRFLIENEARFNTSGLYVTGHSAGAHLAAMACCGDRQDPLELPAGSVRGALLSSGIYELEPVRLCFANADIGLDGDQVEKLSPARLLPVSIDGPILSIFGGAETEEFEWQAKALGKAMRQQGANSRELQIDGANHYTIVPEFFDPDSIALKAFKVATNLSRK